MTPYLTSQEYNLLKDNPVVILDTETTGFSPIYHRITEVAWCRYLLDGWDRVGTQATSALINPDRSIPNEVQQLTGITPDMVRDKPLFGQSEQVRQLWTQLKGAVLVGHYVKFDRDMLEAEWARAGVLFPQLAGMICTVDVMRRVWPNRGVKLADVCERVGIPLKAHRAGPDVNAVDQILRRVIKRDMGLTV